MNEQERLEKVKNKHLTYAGYTDNVTVNIDYKTLEWIIQQAEEKYEWKDTAQSYYVTNQELREKNQRYKQVLKFYADESNYDYANVVESKISSDNGKVARQALRGDTNAETDS